MESGKTGTRILVVDDDGGTRRAVRRVLAADGHEIVECDCGEQALETFRRQPFSLVLTDVNMGAMSGLELLREIRLRDPEAMVIVMTGNACLETTSAALRAGAYDYLAKPFPQAALLRSVRRALDRGRLEERNRSLEESLHRNEEELELVNAHLTTVANRDGLTGLYNHRYFREALEQELSRGRRHRRGFSVVLVDIDHFKIYNDTHGHVAGDDLLRTLARVVLERCRASTLAARHGGESFLLLVPETSSAGAGLFADSIRKTVEAHPFPGRESQPLGRVTISAGVAAFPEAGVESHRLVESAESALRAAKRMGRNTVTLWEPTPVSAS